MNRKDLYRSFNVADDEILERSETIQKGKKHSGWMKWTAAAACLCLIVAVSSIALRKPSDVSAIPFVKVNDIVYVYDSTGYKTDELPQEYQLIGEVSGNTNSASNAQNGQASGPKIGEKIYQCPAKTDEVLVCTTLFSADKTYRYIKFVAK